MAWTVEFDPRARSLLEDLPHLARAIVFTIERRLGERPGRDRVFGGAFASFFRFEFELDEEGTHRRFYAHYSIEESPARMVRVHTIGRQS